MYAFSFAALTAAIVCICGREGVRVARLAAAFGSALPLLAAVGLGLGLGVTIAAWAGLWLGSLLDVQARLIVLGAALALCAVAISILRAPAAPVEPTRSAGAIVLVVLAGHVSGGAALLALGFAVGFASPLHAGLGAFTGAMASLALAATLAGHWEERLPLSRLRILGTGALAGGAAMMLWHGFS